MPTGKPLPDEQFDDLPQQVRAGLLGMWVFLMTELLLFGGAFAAFVLYRMQHAAVFAEAAGHLDLQSGSLNTLLLLTSGLLMALAEQAMRLQRRPLTLGLLIATLVLGLAFLSIKGLEWYKEYAEQLMPMLWLEFHYPGKQPEIARLFFNFYFTLTGLHALHMLIGVSFIALMTIRISRWHEPHRLSRQLRIVGMYWAFVDVLWIFMFTLLYLLRS